MIHTLALYLADHIWGAENLPKDGNYGPRGDQAVKWLNERIEHIAKCGSGEFASRPYMIYNVGTLLTLDNEFVDGVAAARRRRWPTRCPSPTRPARGCAGTGPCRADAAIPTNSRSSPTAARRCCGPTSAA